MPESPQVQSPNILILDTADSPDLKEMFQNKGPGDKCRITLELAVMSKRPEEIKFSVEKVIAEGSDYPENEAEPDLKHPIMATMRKKQGRKEKVMSEQRGGEKHSGPPQTAENATEPWMTSYT